jgi:hypothetical protein
MSELKLWPLGYDSEDNTDLVILKLVFQVWAARKRALRHVATATPAII